MRNGSFQAGPATSVVKDRESLKSVTVEDCSVTQLCLVPLRYGTEARALPALES